MKLYGIPNCDTVRKARAWLAEHGLAHAFHDFKKAGVPEDRLQAWLAGVGWEVLLNRRGSAWRGLDEVVRAAGGRCGQRRCRDAASGPASSSGPSWSGPTAGSRSASTRPAGAPDGLQPVLRRPAAMPLIDRWMPRCNRSTSSFLAGCRRPAAVAAQQFHLQVVQRVQVREPVRDAARQRRIGLQPLVLAR
jgi:hypothetical protein